MQLPANFRTAQSDYKKVESGVYPSREGLNELRMSGRSFFSKNEFLEMLKHVPKKDLVVIDLRAESHGYINDNGVSWYSRYKTFNKGQSAQEVDRREKSMLQTALMNGTMDIATLKSDKDIENQVQEKVNSVQTEGEFLESQSVKYYRVPTWTTLRRPHRTWMTSWRFTKSCQKRHGFTYTVRRASVVRPCSSPSWT